MADCLHGHARSVFSCGHLLLPLTNAFSPKGPAPASTVVIPAQPPISQRQFGCKPFRFYKNVVIKRRKVTIKKEEIGRCTVAACYHLRMQMKCHSPLAARRGTRHMHSYFLTIITARCAFFSHFPALSCGSQNSPPRVQCPPSRCRQQELSTNQEQVKQVQHMQHCM